LTAKECEDPSIERPLLREWLSLSAVGWSCIVANSLRITSKESDEPSRDLCSRVVLSAAVSESNRSESLGYYLERVSSTIEIPPIDQAHVSPGIVLNFSTISIRATWKKKFYNKEPIESKAGIFYKRREKRRSDFGSRRKKESEEEEAASASR
jgi:hypothetical protein